MNKKAIRWLDQWAEVMAFSVMALGLLLAMLSDSALINYVIIILCGFVVGRAYYIRKSRLRMPFHLATLFFLLGFIIGTQLTRRGGIFPLLICFFLGVYLGFSLYKRGLLR